MSSRRYAPLRFVLAAVVVLLTIALVCVQLASDALFAFAGTPGSLPSHMQAAWGARVYALVERVAPAPFVESSLARDSFARGDLMQAQKHALLLPASPVRDELLAEVARARGQQQLALEYFLVAPDMETVHRYVRTLAHTDPVAAYALEERFKDRLEALTTHPDAVAEAYWTLGQLATQRHLYELGLRNYRQAVSLAPLSEKYLLAAAGEALLMHDWATAHRYYQRCIDVDPTSEDAYAGLRIATSRERETAR